MCLSKIFKWLGCAFFVIATLPVVMQARGHTSHSSSSSSSDKVQIFDHDIQLQLADAFGVPVPNTEFLVTLKVRKEGPFVTIQLPAINFQTGQMSGNSAEDGVPVLVPGGYIYTTDRFLSCDLRPNDIVNRSYFGPCNNGANLAFSYLASELPTPITGYLLQVTNAGGLTIQAAGTLGNIIPPGQQNLLPTTISYIVQPPVRLKHNTAISAKFSNTTKFPFPPIGTSTPYVLGYRDTTVNDAFGGVAAWVWSDNSNVADQTQAISNIAVAVGRVNKEGELKVRPPQFLTNYIAGSPTGSFNFDRAIAINRQNPDNIVVTWAAAVYPSNDVLFTGSFLYRAVSFDGGKTWPYNGTSFGIPQPSGVPVAVAGDNRGVACDKYGNFWYSATNIFDEFGNFTNTPYFAVSTDGGITFQIVYTFPVVGTEPSVISFYDFPQYCFGGDGQGNYGLHFTVDLFPNFANGTGSPDGSPFVGFIPIYGSATNPDNIGTAQTACLSPQFLNNAFLASITASEDGRVWTHTIPIGTITSLPGSAIVNKGIVYKSPGPIGQNYVGPWDFANDDLLNFFFQGTFGTILVPGQADAQPAQGFWPTAQTIVYDDARQALYAIVNGNYPDFTPCSSSGGETCFSQNMKLYFAISRDNGQSWSNPIDIASTDFANRGFMSMALDTDTGNLLFGWYDGRNDPTLTGVQYFGAVLDAKTLDRLVKQIPLSNRKCS